jgi:N-methylhydantoinase A/oxoprolinase/acetone carboxylase beta subunit
MSTGPGSPNFSLNLSPSFSIGIDTGGTYTDAVIVDVAGHRVLASAKALTTKGDLSIGIGEALQIILTTVRSTISPAQVGLVSVSTTLATNAVVEGHSDDVGVVLIGFDDAMAARTKIATSFPRSPILRVTGGHDHNGEQRSPLDEALLEKLVAEVAPSITSFAVSSTFAVRNPAHEKRAAQIIAESTNASVTTSSELTSSLDAPRRALTAVLNAQLVGKISALIDAVSKSMAANGIDAPLMLVKGDGSRALASSVHRRPIETVLSGPAASLIGAGWLTGDKNFLMSDIGGTTTDMALLMDGRPRLADQGAEVGGWRTMVRAIDIRTTGLGGDSGVHFDGRKLELDSQRVIPLSLLATRHPEIIARLQIDIGDSGNAGSMHGRFVVQPFGSHEATKVDDPSEALVLQRVTVKPMSLRDVSSSPRMQRAIESLRRRGLVQLSGFTPSDAAHVLGLQDNWPNDGARFGAYLGARFRLMKEPTEHEITQYAYDVWNETVRRSVFAFIEAATEDPNAANSPTYAAIASGNPTRGVLDHSVTMKIPLVGVGGPAPVFYPEAAQRLGARLILPKFGDVANAVGAATGVVTRTITTSVTGEGSGTFRAHGPKEARTFTEAGAALTWATEEARHAAVAEVAAMGAAEPSVRMSIEKIIIPGFTADVGLVSAEITAEATGWPAT